MGKLGKGEGAEGADIGKQSGGEWFSKALGGPVSSDYMCVWLHAQGSEGVSSRVVTTPSGPHPDLKQTAPGAKEILLALTPTGE